MPVDLTSLSKSVETFYGNKPHPDLPEIKVKDFQAFRRVAGRMFSQPQPSMQQVSTAYHALTGAGVSPAEFERVWDVAKPLSNRLLNRDPSIHDVQMLTQKMPGEIHGYYMDHPHPDYPESSAGDIARYASVSREAANRLAGRDPITSELHMFNMGGYTSEDILDHYASDGSEWKK